MLIINTFKSYNMGIYQSVVIFGLLFVLPAILVTFIRRKKEWPLSIVWKIVSWVILILGIALEYAFISEEEVFETFGLTIPVVIWVFTLAIFILIQLVLPSRNNNKKDKPTSNKAELDDLIKYKEMLDKGVITQEEFEIKKKEILQFNEQLGNKH